MILRRILGSALLMLAVTLAGCSSTITTTAPEPDDGATDARVAAETEAASSPVVDEAENEAKLMKREAKRARLAAELDLARQKLARAELEAGHKQADSNEKLRAANAEQAVAVRKLEDFDQKSAPLRLERGRLALKRSEDNVQETEEELQQLEMMYSEEELGDKTAEIVLVRAQRRLTRARWDLDLRRQEQAHLEQEVLPIERMELEMTVTTRTEGVQAKQRAADGTELANRIAVMTAEAEVSRIEMELQLLDLDVEE